MGMGEVMRMMAERAAAEIKDGMIVNLGIGLPSLVPDCLPAGMHVMFQAENGILGIGPTPLAGMEDPNLCNAGGLPVTLAEGGSYFDSAVAFGMIRRGFIDLSILGALEVSAAGDLANWIVPGKRVPGIGGAVELAERSKRVIVMMRHTDKYGRSKLKKECSLPLTAKGCVGMVITDRGVFSVEKEGLVLETIFPGTRIEELARMTEAPFTVRENLQKMGEAGE